MPLWQSRETNRNNNKKDLTSKELKLMQANFFVHFLLGKFWTVFDVIMTDFGKP